MTNSTTTIQMMIGMPSEAFRADGEPGSLSIIAGAPLVGRLTSAAKDAHRRHRHDEGWQHQLGRQRAVERAHRRLPQRQRERRQEAEPHGEGLRRGHAGDRDDRADGQVDLAQQDHPGHAEGGDGDHRHLLQDVHEVG
jgi:hypothetical protein